MSKKKKLKLLLLDEWELEEQEAWFNDMARKGWFLEKLSFWFAVFVEGNPENLQYRLEVSPKHKPLENEQIELYEEVGWEYITSRRFIHVFREKREADVIEIHTDPIIQAETIEQMKKSMLNRGIAMIVLVSIGLLLSFFGFTNLSSQDLLDDHFITKLWSLFIYIFLAVYIIRGIVHISLLLKKLKNSEPFNHHKPYKRKYMVRKLSMAVFLVLSSGLMVSLFIDTLKEPYPEIPETPPVVSLTELESISLKDVVYSTGGLERKQDNHFIEKSSLLVPKQYELRQKFIIPDTSEEEQVKYEPSIRSHRYEAVTTWIAEKLLETLKWEEHEKIELNGFDEAWIVQEDEFIALIARIDDTVVEIRYNGSQPSSVLKKHLEAYLKDGK